MAPRRTSQLLPATIALLLLTFLPAQSTIGQHQPGTWEVLTNAPDAVAPPRPLRHDDIFFINAETGWLVNTAGRIYKTTDSGQSWGLQADDPQLTFRSVTFINESTGFAGLVSSEPDVLFETRDGGATWTNISTRVNASFVKGLCGMQAVSESVIVGVGAFWGSPAFIRSDDGGATWTSTDMSQHAGTLVDVHFFDDMTGLAIGGSAQLLESEAIILLTEDGGSTWQNVHTTSRASAIGGEWGWKISFPERLTGYVSVEYLDNPDAHEAKILKTDDGGDSWSSFSVTGSTDNFGLQGIGFVDSVNGWVGGRGTSSVTTDGGLTWSQLEPYDPFDQDGQLDPRLNRIFVLSDTVAYAVGRFVHRFVPAAPVNTTPQTSRVDPGFSLSQNYPNPFNESTTISYTLATAQPVRIRVFGPTGRHIRTLLNVQSQPPGEHSVRWDTRNSVGHQVSSGIYFLVMDIGDIIEMKKLIHVRQK